MKIRFLGHASFLLTTAGGTRIVTDPVDSSAYSGSLNYRPFNEPADVVTVSHDHGDHAGLTVVKGSPVVLRGAGKFAAAGVEFLGVATCHDQSGGGERGRNTVFVIEADGMRIAHMGDLGHVLTSDQAAEMGNVDVMLVPVGGFFTIDAAQASQVADQLDANVVIPMHYRTAKCSFPIEGVDSFVEGKANVVRPGGPDLELTREAIPQTRQIVVLEAAL